MMKKKKKKKMQNRKNAKFILHSIFQLHNSFVTNPAEKLQTIKQRHNLWIWKDGIHVPQHVLVDMFVTNYRI